MNTTRTLLAMALSTGLLVAGCGGDNGGGGAAAERPKLTKVTFVDAAPFKINLYPFNVAKELGYFEEEGLDVELEPVDGTEIVVKQVAAGRAQFGYGASEGALLGASQNPGAFHAFYDVYNTGTFQLYAAADSSLTSVRDLRGKTVGVESLDTGEAVFTRITAANGGIESGLRLQPVGESTANEITALQAGRVDAVAGPVDTFVAAKAKGVELTCLTCELPQPASSAVMVNADFLAENRDLVAAFGRALARATVVGESNPDAALEIMERVAPEQFTDERFARESMAVGVSQLRPRSGDYGAIDRAAWQRQVEFLTHPESRDVRLEQSVDLDEFLVDDLTAQINDFDRKAVEQADYR